MYHPVTINPSFLHLHPPSLYSLTRFMSNKSVDHPQQVGQMNVIFFPQEMKKGKGIWKEVFIIQTINRREQPFNTIKRYDSFAVTKVEGQDGTIIGKRYPLFDYTENEIVKIYAYKK